MGEHPSGQKRLAYLLPLSRFYEVLFQKRWMQKLAERPSSNTDRYVDACDECDGTCDNGDM